jgi:putative ABC transport system substrate-binding protein
MRRRDLIAGLLVTTAIGRAHAQQEARVYRIAVVSPSVPVGDMSETGGDVAYAAFFKRLRQLGYVEGESLAVARYSGEGRTENYAELAQEAIRGNPDLVVAVGFHMARSLPTIPVVTNSADPIAEGIAASLAQPGGNITGVTISAGSEMTGKRLEVLREMVPSASRVGWLSARRWWESRGRAMREAAERNKVSLLGPPLDAPIHEAEYRRVFAEMAQEGVDALFVGGEAENFTNRRLIVELAEKARLPALYPYHEFAEIGGLIVYGVDLREMFRHMAEQADQILKGAKPGDIPFYQPTKFHLVINVKTAKTLGITVPPTLLIAADEVIE